MYSEKQAQDELLEKQRNGKAVFSINEREDEDE